MTRFRWLLLLFAFALSPLFGREVNAATVNAATCSQADVLKALQSANSGDTVQIPAGTCTWTTELSYTAPGSISIIGAGNQSVVGGGDQTVIIDNVNHSSCNCPTFAITTASASSVFRLSGITIKQNGSSVLTDNGILNIYGNSQNIRLDHIHFAMISGVGGVGADIHGWIYGVVDHSLFDLVAGTVNNGVRVDEATMSGDTAGMGNGSWAAATNFGSNQFIFFENNTYNGGFANDCNGGGRQVFRYNTFNDSTTQAHEMEGDLRGCRAAELYNNTYVGNASDDIDSTILYETRMGTTLIWGNITTGYHDLLYMYNDRTNTEHPQAAPPADFGMCGTGLGPSVWDQNTNSAGYGCIDQVGRGQGDLLTGSFPHKVDSVTGTATWPHQKLEPVYEWMNQYNVPAGFSSNLCFSGDTNTIQANRDFYCSVPVWNGTSFNGAFTGAVGTGWGLLAVRPASCTPLTAYWATDTNTLYQCATPNAWTAYYTPYTYPHPLVTSGSGSSGTVSAPSNLAAVVN